MLSEIFLENVKELKIAIDWKNKKINYLKLKLFDTPGERRLRREKEKVEKKEGIKNRLLEYVRKRGPCNIKLSSMAKNRKGREELYEFVGCRKVNTIVSALHELLKEKKIFRYRVNTKYPLRPYIYSIHQIQKQDLVIEKKEKKTGKIKERLIDYAKKQKKFTLKHIDKYITETNNKKTIDKAVKELLAEGKLARSRDGKNRPYIYHFVDEKNEDKREDKKIRVVKRACPRCNSIMRLEKDEEGTEFLSCWTCSERIYL